MSSSKWIQLCDPINKNACLFHDRHVVPTLQISTTRATRFIVQQLSEFKERFLLHSETGQFLSAELDGTFSMKAKPQAWEEFTWKDGQLMTFHKTFVYITSDVIKHVPTIIPSQACPVFKSVGNPTLAAFMIVKDEATQITRTLKSLFSNSSGGGGGGRSCVEKIVILDTGSTDGTQQIVADFCKEKNVELCLKQTKFIDYSTSRNEGLDFADDKADWILLLDSNDELDDPDMLRSYINDYKNSATAVSITQRWHINGKSNDYFSNVRLVRARTGWRYVNRIHEYITSISDLKREESGEVGFVKHYQIDHRDIQISQDRALDNGKSLKRWERDLDVLAEDIAQCRSDISELSAKIADSVTSSSSLSLDPTKQEQYIRGMHAQITNIKYTLARQAYFRAKTFHCLGRSEPAYEGFVEFLELPGAQVQYAYQAMMFCGHLSVDLKMPWDTVGFMWYTRALNQSWKIFGYARAEPCYYLGINFKNTSSKRIAFAYAKQACEAPLPGAEAFLYVEREIYSLKRWRLMSEIAQDVNEYKLGLMASLTAFKESGGHEIDRHNVRWYEKIHSPKELLAVTDVLEKTQLYIIATADESLRYEKSREELVRAGFKRISKFDATMGKDLTDSILREVCSKRAYHEIIRPERTAHEAFTNTNSVACWMSHRRVLQNIKKNGYSKAFVAESDVCMTDEFYRNGMNYLHHLPADDLYDIALLGHYNAGSCQFKKIGNNNYWSELAPGSYFWGLHLYIVTQRGAQNILKMLDKAEGQLDAELSWMISRGLVVLSPNISLANQTHETSSLQVVGQVFTFFGKNGAKHALDGIF